MTGLKEALRNSGLHEVSVEMPASDPMTNIELERACWSEMVNEISDICMTSYVTDKMTPDEVLAYYQELLGKIYDLLVWPGPPIVETSCTGEVKTLDVEVVG